MLNLLTWTTKFPKMWSSGIVQQNIKAISTIRYPINDMLLSFESDRKQAFNLFKQLTSSFSRVVTFTHWQGGHIPTEKKFPVFSLLFFFLSVDNLVSKYSEFSKNLLVQESRETVTHAMSRGQWHRGADMFNCKSTFSYFLEHKVCFMPQINSIWVSFNDSLVVWGYPRLS